jgi:molybdopterin synthase catalytic subunit
MFVITEEKIETDDLIGKVSTPASGAISVFIGNTRNFTGDFDVAYLFYEAYHEMSIKMMERIGREVSERFKIQKIAITHRIGRVDIGESSVVIAVSASHRVDAIEACHYAIDTLKKIVPIWKKEFMSDGQEKWIANNPN